MWILLVAVGCRQNPTTGVNPSPSPTPVTAEAKVYTKEILSKPYRVNKKYRSMLGPSSSQSVFFNKEPELLWIVGYETEVIDMKDGQPLSQEFMCHANLDLGAATGAVRSASKLDVSERLFTLSQGQQSIRFPDGFGIPIPSDYPLSLTTQVLNLNQDKIDQGMRHRVKIHYLRDSELKTEMKAVFMVGAEALKAVSKEGTVFGSRDVHPIDGPGCSIGLNADPHGSTMRDSFENEFIGHWVVPPGREVTRTGVTQRMSLPFDVRAHYIAIHVHPTCESLELVDTTTMESVYRAEVTPTGEGLGIKQVDFYSSQEGLLLKADHDYSLISTYQNDTGEEVDSMAVMFLYCHDPKFDKDRILKRPERTADSVYPGAVESDRKEKRGVLDISWTSGDSVGNVTRFYQDIGWNGPQGGGGGYYWTYGSPKTTTLDRGPVESISPDKDAGLLWVWDSGQGLTYIRFSLRTAGRQPEFSWETLGKSK